MVVNKRTRLDDLRQRFSELERKRCDKLIKEYGAESELEQLWIVERLVMRIGSDQASFNRYFNREPPKEEKKGVKPKDGGKKGKRTRPS